MSRLFHKREHQKEGSSKVDVNREITGENNSTGFEKSNGIKKQKEVKVLEGMNYRNSKTWQHLGTYPLVQQTKTILHQFPPTRIILANTIPIADSILSSRPVELTKPITGPISALADNFINQGLILTETIVPAIKTTTYESLAKQIILPYVILKLVVVKVIAGVKKIIYTYIINPSREQILNFRKYYNRTLFDTHGKPIIRGSLDFIFGPANRKYEKLIIRIFPESEQISSTGFSNEFDRNIALTFNMIGLLIPAAAKKTSNVIWGPCNYVGHVNHVINEHLDKQENLGLINSWKAIKASTAELNRETLVNVKRLVPKRGKSRQNEEATEAIVLNKSELQQEQKQPRGKPQGIVTA